MGTIENYRVLSRSRDHTRIARGFAVGLYLPFRAEGHFFLGTTPKWAYEGQFTTIILHSIQDYYVNGYDTLQSTPSLHINLHCKKYSPKLSLQRVGEGLDAAEYC